MSARQDTGLVQLYNAKTRRGESSYSRTQAHPGLPGPRKCHCQRLLFPNRPIVSSQGWSVNSTAKDGPRGCMAAQPSSSGQRRSRALDYPSGEAGKPRQLDCIGFMKHRAIPGHPVPEASSHELPRSLTQSPSRRLHSVSEPAL